MAITVDETQYSLVPFVVYKTLNEKLQALQNKEVLLVKNFEKRANTDVLIKLVDKKFTVVQVSYDLHENEHDPRYWVTFNVGINDLSLFTVLKFDETLNHHTNMFKINDIVQYVSSDGIQDSAIIEEVYAHNTDPDKYAYRLSRDPNGLYAEEDLQLNIYM
jgi:DNA mismatch repair ATPase MutS